MKHKTGSKGACPPAFRRRSASGGKGGLGGIIMLLASCFLLLASRATFAQESVCFTCHEDAVKEWRQSIHYKDDISCHNCHGGNPKDADTAMDPSFGFVGRPAEEAEIPGFCGKCHAGVKENYIKSEHSHELVKGGPSCITCHTAHLQKRARIELISEELCGKCHSFERAEKIRNAMLLSETEIANLEKRIETLHVQGYDMAPIKKSLFATRNKFHRLTHVLNVDLILKETTGIQTEVSRLKNEITASERTEVKRRIYGSIFIIFLILGAFIFWWYRNTIVSE